MTQVEVYKACHEAFALLHGRFREVPEFIVISGDDGSCVVRHSGVDWWMKGDCIRTIVPGHHGFNFGGITVEAIAEKLESSCSQPLDPLEQLAAVLRDV